MNVYFFIPMYVKKGSLNVIFNSFNTAGCRGDRDEQRYW
jgi:hypothetical protein